MCKAIFAVFPLTFLLAAAPVLRAQNGSREADSLEVSRPLIRGGIAFRNYCALCHGERGDGVARAAKLYEGLDLKIKPKAASYYQRIILRGGKAVGASPFMPPWKNELSSEQVDDILAYLVVVANPLRRGEIVFKTNCALCHGVQGDGNGRAAKLFNPPPANLRKSTRTVEYKEQVIRLGGEAMGRSSVMPRWDDKLSEIEIADLLVFLRSISETAVAH